VKNQSNRYHSRFPVLMTSHSSVSPSRSERGRGLIKWLATLTGLAMMAGSLHAQSVFATPQNLGTTSAAQTVTVTAKIAGTVSSVEVLTRGASGLEFAAGTGTSTCAAATLAVGGTCQESVTFTPAYPGLRTGAVVLLDAAGTTLGTAYLSGVGQGPLDVLAPGNVITVAGVYKTSVSTKDGIAATSANLNQPSGVTFDGAGNMYIADNLHNKIRMVCASATSATIKGTKCTGAGIIFTVAGTGEPGYSGDGKVASAATLNAPGGVAIDGAGNLLIADTSNNVIREVSASTGFINTVAGDGTGGFGGDGTGATAAGTELNGPWGVTPDAAGNLYIADTGNQRVRRVDAGTGIITTAAGNGDPSGLGDGKGTYSGDGGPATSAGLSLPYGVAFDASGNMMIPDSANNLVRAVKAVNGAITTASTISTVAGVVESNSGVASTTCANGATNASPLNDPRGVAVDAAGNIYIADYQDFCIRKANVSDGQIYTLSINNQPAITLSNQPNFAQVYGPIGLYVDGLGNVYYADYLYMLIDEIQSNKSVLSYTTETVLEGEESATSQQVLVENDGNASANLTSLTPDKNAALDPASTTCGPTFPFPLSEDGGCNVGAFFAPSTTGDPLLGNIYVAGNTINDSNVNSPMDIVLVGDAAKFGITLTSNPDPSAFGSQVTFLAVVSASSGTPTGSVVLTDSLNGGTATTLATLTLSGGQASYQTAALAVGIHTITATYGADSATATVTQTVYEGTRTTLTGNPASPSTLGTPVVFTAVISAPAGGGQTLSGTVTFTDSAMTFANNTVSVTTSGSGGTATYTASVLPQGVNDITAVFNPTNATQVGASTGSLKQDVQGATTFTLTSSPNPSTYGTAVAFSVAVPAVGTAGATGNVKIVIVPQGQTTPTYNLTAPLSGNPAAGTATISTLPVGTYTATATYAGDANYGSATATLLTPQVVNGVTTTTTAVATPNPGIAGKPDTITATVAAASGTVAPAGTVTFADTFNGSTTQLGGAGVTLSGAGTATIKPTLAAGTHSILISYPGDADDAASSYTLTLVVNAAMTTTTVTATPNPATVGATVTFAATVTGTGGTPTGTVVFTATGTATVTLGTGTLDGTGKTSVTSSTLAAGTYTITATYSGDASNGAGTPGTASLTVGTIPTVTSLTTASTSGTDPQTILVSTVINDNVIGPAPTGTVTFKNGSTVVGTATISAGGAATLTPNLGAGTFTIIAYYGGDATHSPSQSSPVTVTDTGSNYTITITPDSVSIPATENANVTVTLTSVSGFTDTIGLGCASLPAGVNCHFANPSVALAASGTATTQLTIDTNNPLGGGATAMNTPASRHSVVMAGLFLPLSLLLGFFLWRFRKRNSNVWGMVLLVALSGAALLATGCGGFTQSYAAPGTYTIQVIGIGANTDVPAYENVTLTITGK